MTSLALIGPGRHGSAIAELFVRHGVEVVLHHHRPGRAEAVAEQLRALVPGANIRVAATAAEAIADQDIVFLTTLWDAPQRQVIGELGDQLVGKMLVDVSNPLDVTPSGIIPRQPEQGSAGQFVATLLPAGVAQVKAFSNLPTASINAGADRDPRAALPFAADSAATAGRFAPLIEQAGWQPWLAGDLSISRELEIGGAFNQIQGRYGRALPDAAQLQQLTGGQAKLS